MVSSRIDLREKVPVNIVKWAGLENTMNELFNNFEAWEQRNAELVNRFFDQAYFRGEESLINKFTEIKPDIKFEDIKDEWINLAILLYDNWMWDFKACLDKIDNDNLKKAFMTKIFENIRRKLWWVPWWAIPPAPYNDFDAKCVVPWDTNVLWYFQKVVSYLTSKEWAANWKKVLEILKDENVFITNEQLNSLLPAWEQIPMGINLTDPATPTTTKNNFDKLLSFEIGKEADRTINIAKDFSKNFQWLITNSLPAINTIVWESDEYRYNENEISNTYPEYKWRLETIRNNTDLSEDEKDKQINTLRWNFYLQYLKSKNTKIWNALEQLYNNNFDYSKIEPNILKGYLEKVADIRLKMLFDKWINEFIKLNFWNVDEFKNFYKNLADPSKKNMVLNDVNIVIPGSTTNWSVLIPIQKKIIEWPNEWLKDIDQFWKNSDKAFDALPIEFTINKSDINALDITVEDKTKLLNLLSKFDQWDKYEIKWEDIWILIYLFFVINSKLPITEMEHEKQKEIENTFGQAKNHEKWPESKDSGENNEGENEENKEWNEFTPEKFKEKIEKYWPGKFENWSEVRLPVWNSELPGWWYQWMKLKISNVNMKKWTFKWTIFWWELKFKNNIEWKSLQFKMNENFFWDLEKISKDSSKIWLQPDPKKSNFNSFRESLNNKLWTNNLSFPIDWVTWDGDKFMQKIKDENWEEKEVEVKYFWASGDDKSTYKIEYNPFKRSFNVSTTFNWNKKWKDWKSEKKRFSYSRDMDWNNFLIFFSQKWLFPQTEEEAKDAVTRQDNEFKMVNWWKWKLHWFSINNIRNWFKDVFGAIKKKIDEYDKSQTEKFKGIIESPILDALSKLPLPPSVKYAIWERQQDLYNERDSAIWKKIEWYLKIYQADPDFWTTFDQLPPHARTQWWKSLQMIVTDRVKNAKDRMWDPGLYQAAALLLANFEKWWSPYRWLSAEENTWLWVKALLWKAHYEQFLRDKAACIRDRDLAENSKNSWLDKKWLNEALARCEMDYIINNIRWSYWKLPYFGSHENRWIPGKDWTNYIDNPSKRLLSDQFASKLESASKWRFTKSTVEESYWKNKSINNFEIMEDEFGKMWSSRYQKWAGALRRMFDLASDESLKKRAKRHFLTYLLSWALDINCDPGLKKQVYWRAKPMSFVPWMLVKEAGVAENIAILLDDATNWDFSKNVKKYFHRSWQLKEWPDFKWVQNEINKWLTDEKMDKLDDYFSKLPTKDFSWYAEPKKKILEKFKKSLIEEDVEEFDRWLLDNPTIVNNGLLTNINVVSDRLRIEDWEFKWKDSDDVNNKKTFWKNIKESVSKLDAGNPEIVNFVLNKYFSWFWLNSTQDRQKAYQRIRTAYYWKDRIWKPFTYDYNGKWQDLDMWTISSMEIDDIIRYTFQGTVMKDCFSARKLPAELAYALEAFQNFFKKAFDNGTLQKPIIEKDSFRSNDIKVEPLLLWSRSLYKDVFSGESDNMFDDTVIWDEKDAFTDPKKRRKAQKRAFQSWRFINHELAQIEKSFKNRLPKTSYRVITQDSSSDIETRIKWLDAA